MKKLMSKILILCLILSFGIQSGYCATSNSNLSRDMQREKMKRDFEQRLNLTDKQKEKAKSIHQLGRQQMKPVIYQIELDKMDIEKTKQSFISEKAKQEKIEQLNLDIKNQ